MITVMIFIILAVLGLSFGSFINAAVWRIHEQQNRTKRKKSQDLSIVHGRSMCPDCRHTLAWHDLLPVVSWLSLKGKCRYCHKHISWQYPLVELVVAVLFVSSYIFWPFLPFTSLTFLLLGLWLVLLIGFVALAVYDIRWMILPNRIVYPMQIIAVVYTLTALVINDSHSFPRTILDVSLSLICGAGLFYALYHVSKGKWIGYGDIRLAVIIGLVLGSPAKVLLMLFIASLMGTLISLPLLLKGKLKRNSHLPFGPLLIAATVIVYLFGASLIAWYERQFII